MKRPDVFHKSKQDNIALLFNMIQACREDLKILKHYSYEPDDDIIECTKALAKEAKDWDYMGIIF